MTVILIMTMGVNFYSWGKSTIALNGFTLSKGAFGAPLRAIFVLAKSVHMFWSDCSSLGRQALSGATFRKRHATKPIRYRLQQTSHSRDLCSRFMHIESIIELPFGRLLRLARWNCETWASPSRCLSLSKPQVSVPTAGNRYIENYANLSGVQFGSDERETWLLLLPRRTLGATLQLHQQLQLGTVGDDAEFRFTVSVSLGMVTAKGQQLTTGIAVSLGCSGAHLEVHHGTLHFITIWILAIRFRTRTGMQKPVIGLDDLQLSYFLTQDTTSTDLGGVVPVRIHVFTDWRHHLQRAESNLSGLSRGRLPRWLVADWAQIYWIWRYLPI